MYCVQLILKIPNFEGIILQTNASDREVGSVFSQFDNSGSEHPIAYIAGSYYPGRRNILWWKNNAW